MLAGEVPSAELLPATEGNSQGLRRLRDIHNDSTIPQSVRDEFIHDFAEQIRSAEHPPEDLFGLMNKIVYSHEGRQKYQRKGTKITNLAYVRDVLGGLRRLVSLRAMCQRGMITPEFYQHARDMSPSPLPDYEKLDWMNGAQQVVELIKSGAIGFDPT